MYASPPSSSSSSATAYNGADVGESDASGLSPMGGVMGESPSNKMRLSGLGLAGEYACIMRIANGFATGNGRLAAGGVRRCLVPVEAEGGEASGVYVDDMLSVVSTDGGEGGSLK